MTLRTPAAAVAALALTAALTSGCGGTAPPGEPGSAAACTDLPAADVTTPDGWIGYLAAHPDDTGFVVADGTGTVVAHRGDDPQPLASAVKVVHLAAYARAVADGRLDPAEPVPVRDWERWYLPGTDGAPTPLPSPGSARPRRAPSPSTRW